MRVVDRENTVVLEIDLDDYHSVEKALSFIRKSSAYGTTEVIKTTKVKVIKMLRSYGAKLEKTPDLTAGLKSAKDHYEQNIADLIFKEQY